MTDSCLICEYEPIEPNGWYSDDCHNHICPWCVEEMFQNREIVDRLKFEIGHYHGKTGYEFIDKILQSIFKGDKHE